MQRTAKKIWDIIFDQYVSVFVKNRLPLLLRTMINFQSKEYVFESSPSYRLNHSTFLRTKKEGDAYRDLLASSVQLCPVVADARRHQDVALAVRHHGHVPRLGLPQQLIDLKGNSTGH